MQLPDLSDIDAWLAEREAAIPGLRADCQKRVIWPEGGAGRRPLSVVYIHGFSASPKEVSPVSERVAEALGAPLYLARLAGHGRDGPAMAEPTFADWMEDTEEAFAIGAALGERVLVISCSTGSTLATLAMAEGADAAGSVMVSPNFALGARRNQTILGLPLARLWAPIVFGRERSFEPENAAHAQYWTTRYPSVAVFPLIDALKALDRADLSRITAPALFAMNEDDPVVSAEASRAAMARWGGPAEAHYVTMGPGEDPECHVIAGDAMAPRQTGPMVDAILTWAKEAGLG